ncbi:DODA-type extradiol aromatic ring-opening family dioxygenase [Thiorhodococcus fuscus]|uniref:DODA-type extradiol aromatic ring-opening family dioxygenase n=1 Tax=Thiorhodococcus fuscus TaxID=527200 RepID=A0ABW4YD64_9GAMM
MNDKARVLFLSHGGGPLPLLGDRAHAEMVECLEDIAARYPRPSAIILVSAHWEERIPTITSGDRPDLIYDYYGFPEESYEIQYPCPGEPRLAERIHALLAEAGIPSKLDAERGFDHGLFVPLKLMYPEADIPCVQLSLVNDLDPTAHLAMGRALRGLEDENLLVIGSGFSFHNMRAFFGQETTESAEMNAAFEEWLLETCSSTNLDEEERERRLIQWAKAPSARYCHPREEHLLPLQVCYGCAQAPSSEAFELRIMGKKSSMYLWTESPV